MMGSNNKRHLRVYPTETNASNAPAIFLLAGEEDGAVVSGFYGLCEVP